ncbi:hypothetical protein MHYP_G00185690 [Metynnis hypsauchen]
MAVLKEAEHLHLWTEFLTQYYNKPMTKRNALRNAVDKKQEKKMKDKQELQDITGEHLNTVQKLRSEIEILQQQ